MKQSIVLMLLSFAMFTACDDSSSGAGPEPVAEVSSSSTTRHCEEQTEGCDEVISSCSVTSNELSSVGSSVSSSSMNSSPSVMSSSSTGSKSSVSSSSSSTGSSSSLRACSEEDCIIEQRNRETGKKEWFVCENGFYVLFIMSSASEGSSSSYFNMDSLYNSKKSYGEFVDPRDGQKYRTITIEFGYDGVDSITLFATNLNYGKQIKLATTEFDDNVTEKYCYDDDPWYCDNGFGGLYSWSEAFGLPKACDSVWTGTTPACPDSIFPGREYEWQWQRLKIHGACPENWHVMNEDEWRSLMGKDVTETGFGLISKLNEGALANSTGFSALFGGMVEIPTQYTRIWDLGVYHLAFEYEAGRHKSVTMSKSTNLSYKGIHHKKDGIPVRCVKDYLSKSK